MQKKLSLLGAGVIILALLALLLIPSAPAAEKYKYALEQGQYHRVCTGLARELEQNPRWGEGRRLLIDAALAQDRLDLAWEQILSLREGGQDIDSLQVQLDAWILVNDLDPECADAALTLVEKTLEAEDHWDWGWEFYLQILVKLGRGEDIPGAFKHFVAGHSGLLNDKSMMSLSDAYRLMLNTCSARELWEASVLLDGLSPVFAARQWTPEVVGQRGQLDSLQEEFPAEALVAAAWARELDPDQGLAFLREWEGKNTVPEDALPLYGSMKAELIAGAGSLVPDDLRHLSSEHLFQAAVETMANRENCRVILARMEELGAEEDRLELVHSALTGPEPRFSLAAGKIAVLSPDGNWLVLNRGAQWILCDLNTGAEIPLFSQEEYVVWKWAPDSGRVAGAIWSGAEEIAVFDTRGRAAFLRPGPEAYVPVGWYDELTLWVQPARVSYVYMHWLGQPLLCNVETGEVRAHAVMDRIDIRLAPGPQGAIAWHDANGAPCLLQGEETVALMPPSRYIESWVPDGSGVILAGGGGLGVWRQGSLQMWISNAYFLGWKDQTHFYWSRPLSEEYYEPAPQVISYDYPYGIAMQMPAVAKASLHTYDLATGRTEAVGIVGDVLAAADNTVLILVGDRIWVYSLP